MHVASPFTLAKRSLDNDQIYISSFVNPMPKWQSVQMSEFKLLKY